MSKIKVLAGDFEPIGSFSSGLLALTPKGGSIWKPTVYNIQFDVEDLQIADETTGIKVFGAVGWGTLGAVLAGPVGIIVGGLLGGKGKKVVFVAQFKDGKKLMGETDSTTWNSLMAKKMGM